MQNLEKFQDLTTLQHTPSGFVHVCIYGRSPGLRLYLNRLPGFSSGELIKHSRLQLRG